MAEGLVSFLRRDLRDALVLGAARSPTAPPAGAAWLSHWSIAAAAAGLSLYLLAGYHAGFARLNAAASAAPAWLWEWLTMLGDERVAFALTLLLARRWPRVFWSLICAAVVAAAYSRGLKPLFDAARPPAVLAPDTFHLIGPAHRSESFPSGHSTTAGVFFGVLVYYARALHWRVLFLLLGVLAGLSRVALGVHWPVDVAAGLAGGVLAAWSGVWLARRSSWGICAPGLHLALVAVAAIMAASLWGENGGYDGATPLLRVISVATLGFAAIVYVIKPLRRAAARTGRY